ncbi:MAG: aldo/keto reductase [Firmicutes bacterium]|nr:aldo/keto reductase [Bacillota bacterium]
MQYTNLGNTGFEISALGFGAMRLPEYEKSGKWFVDEEQALKMFHRAFELGVNYVDTAWGYLHGNSQYIVGKALKGWSDKVKISTKLPVWEVNKEDDFWWFLDEQLKRLDVDCIDFYHLHALNDGAFENKVKKLNIIENLEKAKQKGLIKHKSFSFHDTPDVMKKIIDTGAFETVLCQYNLLDRSNEDAIAYAKSKGLGVIVMGPVAGGRLAVTSDVLKNLVKGTSGTPEIALRFVLANKNVSCALSGMSTIEMVEENAEVASRCDALSHAEWEKISNTLEQTKTMSDLYCTGCDYCLPCPQQIEISKAFLLYNYHKVYGLTDYAKEEFALLGKNGKGAPDTCVSCGVCAKRCPQNIKIPEKIAQTVLELKE